MARWAIVVTTVSCLLIVSAGSYYAAWGPNTLYRIGGALFIVFGIAGCLDVLVSRIMLNDDSIAIVSLIRRRRYARAEFESAKVDGGSVCLKRRDGGWLVLPSTGANALSVRNTVHAWIRQAGNQATRQPGDQQDASS